MELINYQESDNEFDATNGVKSEADGSRSMEDDEQSEQDGKEENLDSGEITLVKTETDNEEQIVKYPVQETSNSSMDKHEDSEQLVLNMAFDNKKDMDYIYKPLHNQ